MRASLVGRARRAGRNLSVLKPSGLAAAVGQPFRAALAAIIVVCCTGLALAQDGPRPARPYRGLFGGAQSERDRSDTLDLRISLLGGYDDNVLAGSDSFGAGVGSPLHAQGGEMTTGTAALSYLKRRRENWLRANAHTSVRYFPTRTQLNGADYGGEASFSSKPSRRSELTGSADAGYRPFFTLGAISAFGGAEESPAVPVDYGLVNRPSVVYGTTANASYELTRRNRVRAGYSFRGFDFTGASDGGQTRHNEAHAGIERELSRRFTLGGRYAYDRGEGSYRQPGLQTRSHGASLTANYHRALRRRRQLSFGFTGGYSRIERASETMPEPRLNQYLTAGGHVSLEMDRNWTFGGNYRRGLRYLPGIADPVFSDDVQARASGLIARRVDLVMWGQYSRGVRGFSALSHYDATSANVQARWAVNRTVAISGNYVFYRYQFGHGVPLPVGIGNRFDRHGLRVGLDLWLPLSR